MIFIRPWLLLLLLVPLILKRMQKRFKSNNPWQDIISPKLMPYLLIQNPAMRHKKTMWGIVFLWSLLSVAAAGPSFEKISVPGIVAAPGTVFVVDLNALNPEKLTQMKMKLLDFLKELKGDQVGLVLYDQKGYVGVPLTQDLDIIREMIPTLAPDVLPAVGNRPEAGFEKAIQLLENAGQKNGRILFVTGGGGETKNVRQLVQKKPFKVGILGIGDVKTGAPILMSDGQFLRDINGNLQLAQLDEKALTRLGSYVQATPDESDIRELLSQTKIKEKEQLSFADSAVNSLFKADVWKDLGVYLLLITLPFVAFLFRRGVFFSGLFCLSAFSAQASDLWYRPDQVAYQAVEQGISFYKQQEYKKALDRFQLTQTPNGLYNQGNALAHLGRLQEAIKAYEAVLKKEPSHKEAAFNKIYLEKLLSPPVAQQNQKTYSDQQESDEQQDQSSSSNKSSESDEQQDQSSSSNKSSESDEQQDQQASQSVELQKSKAVSDPSASDGKNRLKEQNKTQENKEQKSSVNDQIYPLPSTEKESEKEIVQSTETVQSQSDLKEKQSQEKTDTSQQMNSTERESHFSDENDQETQQLLNRLKKDPSRVLRYRLREQNRRTP